ncbi:SDR family NAD(P)-dependent oxidoreductase [Qipengyuania qiaonensis]|uniref:SDR family oxidoreductase n=1 Tax=Qipengyuania qiaonensis TaxID=2867240 RepID=A0ABS7J7V2_9SPHN|nr:SDR family NAD(P)-dependent oxidoreductase [Qipengyuania qiaonensis]MBX7481708.1 SDR family oxidoreductase [Qipengyuania qiaonensis]
MRRFDNKVAVITGGAAGMGRAHAEHLAAHGARVAIGDLGDASEVCAAIEAASGEAMAHRLDVADEASVAGFAQAVLARFGRCDIIVNNAGIYPFQPFDEITPADWRRVMAVDLDGPFLVSRAFLPGMRGQGYGRIVNIASAEAWMVASNNAHYIAAKMGVVGLTRALATEAAQDGVTVNAIAPGIVRGTTIDAEMPGYLDDIPRLYQAIKRAAEPADIVNAMAFLASDDARFITGQTLVVDGGGVRL